MNKVVAASLLLVVLGGAIFYQGVYWYYAPQYWMNVFRENVPCQPEVVVHDTPFTAFPFMVWSREHGCGWETYISAPIPPRLANSAGYDALPPNHVLWNESFPERGSYYYAEPLVNDTTGSLQRSPPGNASIYWECPYMRIWYVKGD